MQPQKWKIYLCCGLILLQEADRLKCATSVLHQADQACRRRISEAMKTARGRLWASVMGHIWYFTQVVICSSASSSLCQLNFRKSSTPRAHEVFGRSAEWVQGNIPSQPAGTVASGSVFHSRRGHWCRTCGGKSSGCFWSWEKGNPVENHEWK